MFDQHGEIVGELELQALVLFHFLIVKDVASIDVDKKVVFETEHFDFDNLWTFIGALEIKT